MPAFEKQASKQEEEEEEEEEEEGLRSLQAAIEQAAASEDRSENGLQRNMLPGSRPLTIVVSSA